MNIIITDDENKARNALKNLIELHCPELNLIAEAENVQKGLEILKNHQPDLLFLDVEMPDGTGFDLLKKLENIDFEVIFTTAHDKYAINAFKFSAIDYLLKPINPLDLKNAVAKASKEINQENLRAKISTLLSNIQDFSEGLKKIVLKDAENIHIVPIANIIRLESSRNYTTFYLKEDKPIVVSRTIKEFDRMLSEVGFFRSHQSHLINLNALKRFEKKDGGTLIMNDESQVPISVRKKEKLMTILESL